MKQVLRYVIGGTGLFDMVAVPLRAFVRSREGLEAARFSFGLVSYALRGQSNAKDFYAIRHDLLRPSHEACESDPISLDTELA